MSLTQDEKNEIRRENPTYPRVSRTTDPMVVRIDKTSLLVNDTMFTAKLKCGLGYKGYLIYSSGLGTPIYEKAAKTTGEWQKSFSTVGNRPYNIAFDSENTSQLTNVLTAAAKEWLDDLEIAIADRENDNAIKKAIDRLCWQLHYDITESHTNFPEVFKDNDFSDVEIDTGNGKTVNKSIEDNYTAISTSVTDGSSTISGGSSLQGVRSSISSFDGNLCGKFESFNGKFETFDSNFTNFDTSLNGSLNTIGTKLVPDDTNDKKYYSISECLRDKDDYTDDDKKTFSIARSLREGESQTSVSQATHDQTTLESEEFSDIEGRIGITGNYSLADRIGDTDNVSLTSRIGVFNVGGYRSLFDTISGPNGYANTSKHSLNDAVGYLTGVGLEGKLNDIKSVIGDKNDVGVNETISGRVHTMYTSMQGENGVSGFVRYGTWNGETSWYVRAIT